jgi:hypothetical protein
MTVDPGSRSDLHPDIATGGAGTWAIAYVLLDGAGGPYGVDTTIIRGTAVPSSSDIHQCPMAGVAYASRYAIGNNSSLRTEKPGNTLDRA